MTSIIPTSAQQWRIPQRGGIDSLKLVDFKVPQPNVCFSCVVESKLTWKEFLGDVKSQEVMDSGLGGGWDGVFTQYKVFPAFGLVKIPDSLSFEEASTLPCAALSTGGVSIFAMQFALSSGAHCIITSSSDAKLQKAKEIAGVHASRLHLINYTKTPEWAEEVRKIVPLGVNFVVEVGGNATLPKSYKSLAFGGMVAAVGFVGGAGERFPDANGLVITTGGATHRGILIGSRDQFEQMNAHIEANSLKPSVYKVFKFGEMIEAYSYLQSQKVKWTLRVSHCIPLKFGVSLQHVGKVVVKFFD
ncbi:hypothetical protein P7C70_g4580, partial [Phenoliferia sp. Uapishka_3]